LTEKLDYIDWLGINCIMAAADFHLADARWRLRHFQLQVDSVGLRHDARLRAVFTKAHSRGIRVIADLVLNHTSDQHPWFQEARSSPDSPKRDGTYGVTRTTSIRMQGFIFFDSETSNWSWDDQAGAYYWHRFFWHQPDLNFDNPK
jgi:maltose alpha-D-glucosyltransferase/alpha-amylase